MLTQIVEPFRRYTPDDCREYAELSGTARQSRLHQGQGLIAGQLGCCRDLNPYGSVDPGCLLLSAFWWDYGWGIGHREWKKRSRELDRDMHTRRLAAIELES